MNAQTTKLAAGLYVDHNANVPKQLSVGMIGSQYRVVTSWVVDGRLYEEPVDDQLFSGIGEARQHYRALKQAAA